MSSSDLNVVLVHGALGRWIELGEGDRAVGGRWHQGGWGAVAADLARE